MTKLKSVFGAYSERLQVVIDNSLDKFAPNWYPKYFGWAPIQQSLTFTSVIGRSRIEAAASVVDRNAATPLRSRQGLEKLTGEIPAIKEMIPMTESDYRDFLTMQAINVDDATKRTQLLDLLWGDVKKMGDSTHKRLDIMALEAISTGQISLTVTNNPDGLVLSSPVDLLMPSGNKSSVTNTWGTAISATPITDIEAVIQSASTRGIVFEKMLMSNDLWLKFKKTKEVLDTLGAYYYGPKVQGSPIAISTLDKVNEYLTANRLPMIEIVDETIGIEKDGVVASIKPFSLTNVAFIPSGQLGMIKNAIAIEQMQPVGNVNYATYNRAIISKWSQNEPFQEWTKAELNACPSLDAIDAIYLLTAIV